MVLCFRGGGCKSALHFSDVNPRGAGAFCDMAMLHQCSLHPFLLLSRCIGFRPPSPTKSDEKAGSVGVAL